MSDEQCDQFTAALSFEGKRLRCSFNARFTMTGPVAVTRDFDPPTIESRARVCLKHMRKLRAEGWVKVAS